ncbi:hypothetical protein RintRC_4547 [Richelia intracellularis]|nr:hypothetical protein RintRC_4547 [Richelia intracellularis]
MKRLGYPLNNNSKDSGFVYFHQAALLPHHISDAEKYSGSVLDEFCDETENRVLWKQTCSLWQIVHSH